MARIRLYSLVVLAIGCIAAPTLGAQGYQGVYLLRCVTEGRDISLYSAADGGSYQWQMRTAPAAAWTDLRDDGTYRGTTTPILDIRNVTQSMTGYQYHLVQTRNGVVTLWDTLTLNVNPLIFPQPTGLVLEGLGSLLVSDATNDNVRRVYDVEMFAEGNLIAGAVREVAGLAGQSGSSDGDGSSARFHQPAGLLGDSRGVLLADSANGTIRRIASTGVTTVAGRAGEHGASDGSGAVARFATPMNLAANSAGIVYIADPGNHTIRRMAVDGTITTLAGSAGVAGSADGPGDVARFNRPTGITVNASGVIFVTDTGNNTIRSITPDGLVTTLAGLAGVAGSQDGRGADARFNGPTGIHAARGGGIYVADTANNTIRLLSVDGLVATFAGTPGIAGLRDAPWTTRVGADGQQHNASFDSLFDHPTAITGEGGYGFVIVADTGNAAIRVLSAFDDLCSTLPLTETLPAISAQPVPTTPPAPTTPVTPPVATNSAPAGGGGAPSDWFLFALLAAWASRRLAGRSGAGPARQS